MGVFTCRDSAVSERDDAVFGGGDFGLRVYQGIQPGRVRKGSTLLYSIILVELEAIHLQQIIQGQHGALGQRGTSREFIFEGQPFSKISLAFSGYWLERPFPKLHNLLRWGAAPKIQFIPVVAAAPVAWRLRSH